VDGWAAIPTRIRSHASTSFLVVDCPEFRKDNRVNPASIPRDSIHALAAAVVEQAIDDYRACVRGKTLDGERNHGGRWANTAELRKRACEGSMNAIERFFRSDWFYTLCDCDGEAVIRRLREERYLHRKRKANARIGK
jgi:hypothetical protein